MSEHRDLGMHRRIPRRDFLNGVAIDEAHRAVEESFVAEGFA